MEITSIASSSAGNCHVIESCGEQLLIDCGVPLKCIREALNFDLSKVVGCLVSHEHKDHSKAVKELLAKTNIPVYVPVSVYFDDHDLRLLFHDDMIKIGDFWVKPLRMCHDVPCLGFAIMSGVDKLLYATDTGSLDYKVLGLTHLMIETNYQFEMLLESDLPESVINHICEGHLDIDKAVEFAVDHKDTLKEIHLIHLSDRHSDERLFQDMMERATGVPVYVCKK